MPADTGVVEKSAHVKRMREGLPPVSPLLDRPPQDLPSALNELQRIDDQHAVLEAQHGKMGVERTKRFLEEQQGELEVARACFGSDKDPEAPTIDQRISKHLASSQRKDPRGVRTVYDIGGKEVDDPQEARKLITEEVLVKRLAGVRRIRDQIDPGGKLTAREFAAIGDPKAKGQLYAAEMILQAIYPFVVADKMGAAQQSYGAVAEFGSRVDEVVNLDASVTRNKIEKAEKFLPEADTISTLAATEIGGIYGKPSSSQERQSATYLARVGAETAESVINAGTGRRPTDVPFALEKTDPRDPSKRVPINVTEMATVALGSFRTGRANRIMDRNAADSERALKAVYQSDTVTTERFFETVKTTLQREQQLQEEIKRHGLNVPRRIEEEHWQNLLPWRKWAREGLPTVQGGVVVFQEQSAEGTRVTGLIPSPEAFRAVLEVEGVREAIVRLYPLVREGRLAFGASAAVYGSENPALDDQSMKLLGNLPAAERTALGITGSLEETIAFEVLRTWFVHPRPEFRNAWDKQKGPFDSLRRWYFADKWPHFTGNFALVMLRVNKVGDSSLREWRKWFERNPEKKIKDAPLKLLKQLPRLKVPIDRLYKIGDTWGMTERDISELLTNWDTVRIDGAVVELALFYDSAKKATETANALEALFKAGVLPENVFENLYKSERFKHLNMEERGEILMAFYAEAYDKLLSDLKLEAKLKEGLNPGKRAEVIVAINDLVKKGLMGERQANNLKTEVNKVREKGEGVRWWHERTFRYLHNFPNVLTLPFGIIGEILSGITKKESSFSYWGRKIFGWNFYGYLVGGAFFAVNTWNLMLELPVHLAAGRAFLNTFITGPFPGVPYAIDLFRGAAGFSLSGLGTSLLGSPGIWMCAVTWASRFAGRALRRISVSYDEFQKEDRAIRAAKKKE